MSRCATATPTLLGTLDDIVHRHGGCVCLAKDASCAPERAREGYPRFGVFDAVRTDAGAGMSPRFRLCALAEARVCEREE